MIRRLFRFLLGILLLGVVIFFFLAGKITDRSYNSVEELEDYKISPRARDLHDRLLVADLHADNLLWDRDPVTESGHGMVDVPRLIEGGYALQVFSAVIKTPKGQNYESNTDKTDNITLLTMANRWPPATWFNLTERALYQAEKLRSAANRSSGLVLIENRSDLEFFIKLRKSNSYIVSGLLAIEGLHSLEGDFENLEVLYDAGYRMMGLVHFFDNKIGGSSAGVEKGGLTDLGKRIVREMEEKRIIIDLAHSSKELFQEVIEISTRPVVVSHTGLDAIHPSPRNLTDEQLRMVAENGGLVGIGFWPEAVGSTHPSDIAKAIRHAVNVAGIEHVALGSDFDGAVTTSFDASQINILTEALMREGFSDSDIRKIMGMNQINFLLRNLP